MKVHSIQPEESASVSNALPKESHVDRADRIARMLDRWADEDCSGEPDWDVDSIVPLRLGVASARDEEP